MAKKEVNKFIFFAFLFVIIAAMDSFWFTVVSRDFFANELGSLLRAEASILAGVAAWLLLTFGIHYFVIPRSDGYAEALLNGAVFGLVLYGVYDFTNLALVNGWSAYASIVDIFWGAVLCATASLLGFVLAAKVFKIK